MLRRIKLQSGRTCAMVTPFPTQLRNRELRRARQTAINRVLRVSKCRSYKSSRDYLHRILPGEQDRYASVQIGVLSVGAEKRFLLLYAGEEGGTGPFRTRAEAIGWFVRGGR